MQEPTEGAVNLQNDTETSVEDVKVNLSSRAEDFNTSEPTGEGIDAKPASGSILAAGGGVSRRSTSEKSIEEPEEDIQESFTKTEAADESIEESEKSIEESLKEAQAADESIEESEKSIEESLKEVQAADESIVETLRDVLAAEMAFQAMQLELDSLSSELDVRTSSAGTVPMAVHVGFTCDACGVLPIIGPRFHCCVRPDYDLCEMCESKKEEPYESTKHEGGDYSGDLANSIPDGRGRINLPNGTSYIGGWKQGNQEGHGKYTDADGDCYIGGWKQGKEEGHGKHTDANGDCYIGEIGRAHV